MSKTILTEIQLPASREAVWKILADFERYPEWNPFVRQISGQLAEGAALHIQIAPRLSWTVRFSSRVVALRVHEAFGWAGGPACLFHGRRFFELQATPDGHSTHLKHGEIFTGILARPLLFLIGKDPAKGYRAMNEALLKRLNDARTEPA